MTLKDYRIARGITQDKMAEKIGVSKITYFRWEKGMTRPSLMAQRLIEQHFPGVDFSGKSAA